MAKRFKKVYLEISNICNLQCSFCPAVERGKKQIEESTLRNRLKKIAPYAERVCLHVMGEPLAHPQFSEFIDIAQDLKVDIEITTNATLLNDKIKKSLLNPTIKQVNFSLQSFTDNFPTANPSNYLKKILDFCKEAFSLRPDLYINLRLWNIGDTKAGKDTEFFLNVIENEFSVKINRKVDVGFKKSKNVLNRLYLHFDSRFVWPSLKQNKISEVGKCHGLKSHVAILAEGLVTPCCLDKEANISLGQIDDSDFLDIIESPKSKKIREGFNQGKMLEELCQRCDYATRFNKSL